MSQTPTEALRLHGFGTLHVSGFPLQDLRRFAASHSNKLVRQAADDAAVQYFKDPRPLPEVHF